MCWRIELFGGPRIVSPRGQTITHFTTQKTAGVLAYLALTLPRSHPREVLTELFWPEKDPALGRNSLSAALSALRPVLGEILVCDKFRVGLDPANVTTDVAEFERCQAMGDLAGAARVAVADFLPGFYDDWVLLERERLEARREQCAEAAAKLSVGQQGRLYHFPLVESEFIGRREERAALWSQLESGRRLLTIKGMGGVGKTRLAYETTRTCRAHFPGGIFWIALEDLRTGDALLRTVAASLRLPLQPQLPVIDQLARALEPRGRVLLVLDNTEQIPDAGLVVRGLLAAAPETVCLVTSRKLLGLRGEACLELAPLPLSDAESLFHDRVRSAQSAQQATITELCRRLDGLPLALELAAARCAILSPSLLLTRFEERFHLLRGRGLDLPERQQTLQTLIDWSFDLLEPEAQVLLKQLSVFVGGFSLEDVEAVCEGGEVWEGLSLLYESSLVSRESPQSFALLESVRLYAADRLALSPERQAETREGHARHYLARAQAQLARLRTRSEAEALRQLDRLAPNLQAALEHASPELAPGLALALARPLQRRGFFTEAVPFLERVLATQRLPELVWERAGLHFDQGEYAPAHQLADEARVLYAAGGDPVGEARSENLLGQIAYKEQRWKVARGHLKQALVGAEDPIERAIVLNNLALVELEDPCGDPESAVALLTEALAVRQAQGDLRGVAAVVANLGNLAFARADWAAAVAFFEESLEVEAALGNVFGVARALNNLGETVQQQGESTRALRLYLAAHQLFTNLRHDYAAYTESLILTVLPAAGMSEEQVEAHRQAWAGKSMDMLIEEVKR